jgi:phenylpropionate dioxygenase-like ring-hydroxylating dioxygenase large terminal subunit
MTQVNERPTRTGDAGPGINGPGINGLAASWYVAMPAERLRAKPVALRLFGQDLVAWRDGAGRPVIMPRYCPHQGASLAIGSVADGCLRCPFHGWRFDAAGTCVLIPSSPSIPPTARIQPYPSAERYGYVWAWYGGSEPLFELPDFPALEGDRDSYAGFRFDNATTGTSRQLLENAIDYFHFNTLHGLELNPMELRVLRDPLEASDNGAPIAADAWFGFNPLAAVEPPDAAQPRQRLLTR